MLNYILRRLFLLPLTLFCIVLVNFVILNLAPGDPTSRTEITPEGGASRREDRSQAFGTDDRYLTFREFYGLTMPILFNWWPSMSQEEVNTWLWRIVHTKWSPEDTEEMPFKSYQELKVAMGDRSRYVMPKLLHVMQDGSQEREVRRTAVRFFIRGGSRQAYLGPTLTAEQKTYNRDIGEQNLYLASLMLTPGDDDAAFNKKVQALAEWYGKYKDPYHFEPKGKELVSIFFTQTRFFRYFSRVLTFDFGTMRNDNNKTVISEVTKRFKYSLTLSLIPMVVTIVLCIIFGFMMALYQNRWPDFSLNFVFLVLYATPVFVVAPFLIEKIALNHDFPFTNTPIPISGFTSPSEIYDGLTSSQRILDVAKHIFLPLIAILYGGLAAQARLARTSVLEVLRQDYVRTAKAKGVSRSTLLTRHVGRNAAITIVTSIAGSLGIVLGGSLIVETLFQIDGFGKFFYDAILNRDYNVVMFSALAGSFLGLLGYLMADLAYAFLDPRVTLD